MTQVEVVTNSDYNEFDFIIAVVLIFHQLFV